MNIKLIERGIDKKTAKLGQKIDELLEGLPEGEEKVLEFEKGIYYIKEKDCFSTNFYITNTMSEKEMAVPAQQFGFVFKKRKNVVFKGNETTFMFEGRTSLFAFIECENITLDGITVDFEPASIMEFDVSEATDSYITFTPNKESTYTIKDGVFRFDLDEEHRHSVMQYCDVANKITERVPPLCWRKSPFDDQTSAKLNDDNSITVYMSKAKYFNAGFTYQFLFCKRDGTGVFIDRCKDTVIKNCVFHYMHGMGIMSQLSHNVTVDGCKIVPNTKKRTTATFADMIHSSMCSGQIRVTNSEFDGSRDDIINVHGNHFEVEKVKGCEVIVKFRHPQAYGFQAFFKGNEVEFINKATLLPLEKNVVVDAELIDSRTIKIILETPVSKKVKARKFAVENTTMTAELYVDNIKGSNIPTRGILVTTRRKVVIKNSVFEKMQMSAVLISNDASTWYESGYVRDVLIENNKFIECQEHVIKIMPENKKKRGAVHKNIRVLNNEFVMRHDKVAMVKCVDGFEFRGNKITGSDKPCFDVIASQNVDICTDKK